MKIALYAPNGCWVTAESGGDDRGIVIANRTWPEPMSWETWTVEPQPNGLIALKSANGRYLCAESGGGGAVHANRTVVGEWEQFNAGPFLPNASIVFRTSDGEHFISIGGDGVLHAIAGAGAPFRVVVVDNVDAPVVVSGPLSRLVRIEGHRMVNERGEKIYGRGASAFLLYKKFLDGEDITPQLTQLQGLGCNLIRVMGMFESLGGFNPKAYGGRYYDDIHVFCALCESFGIYVLWTACAATAGVFQSDEEVVRHIKMTVDQLLIRGNAIFSPVNEQGQHNNSINRQRVFDEVLKPLGGPRGTVKMLYDTGSFGMDQPCEPPFGTHVVLHNNRHYSNSVRDCCVLDHPNYVNNKMEVGLDEPDRYGTTNDDRGNGSVQQAEDAAGTAYTAIFFVLHSLEGERGNVLTGNTLDCAVGAFAAMKGR